MLWRDEMFNDLYGPMIESDLTKTQNTWFNNGQKKLVATAHINWFFWVRMKTTVGGASAVFRYMRGCLETQEKPYLRISPKCWCFLIVVVSRNELGDGIVVNTGWFRMLWQHLNTVYGRNISCMCSELWRTWFWHVIEENGTVREGPDVRRV